MKLFAHKDFLRNQKIHYHAVTKTLLDRPWSLSLHGRHHIFAEEWAIVKELLRRYVWRGDRSVLVLRRGSPVGTLAGSHDLVGMEE